MVILFYLHYELLHEPSTFNEPIRNMLWLNERSPYFRDLLYHCILGSKANREYSYLCPIWQIIYQHLLDNRVYVYIIQLLVSIHFGKISLIFWPILHGFPYNKVKIIPASNEVLNMVVNFQNFLHLQ